MKENQAVVDDGIEYVDYINESMIGDIQALVSKDLSEPYSIFTYRYFLHKWPNLCICVYANDVDSSENKRTMIGVIVCKAEDEGEGLHGYIAMLAVNSAYRKKKIGFKVSCYNNQTIYTIRNTLIVLFVYCYYLYSWHR